MTGSAVCMLGEWRCDGVRCARQRWTAGCVTRRLVRVSHGGHAHLGNLQASRPPSIACPNSSASHRPMAVSLARPSSQDEWPRRQRGALYTAPLHSPYETLVRCQVANAWPRVAAGACAIDSGRHLFKAAPGDFPTRHRHRATGHPSRTCRAPISYVLVYLDAPRCGCVSVELI